MRDLLGLIRVLALVVVALSVIALPIAGVQFFATVILRNGDGGLGGLLGAAFAVFGLIAGGSGLVLGGSIAMLAKSAIATPAEIRGLRRDGLVAGLLVAAGEVLVLLVLSPRYPLGPGFSFIIGLTSTFASTYLLVAAAAASRRASMVAAGLGVALLLLGGLLIGILLLPPAYPSGRV